MGRSYKFKGIDTMRECARCGKTLPIGDFYRDASRARGVDYYCKECRRAYGRSDRTKFFKNLRRRIRPENYRLSHPERQRIMVKLWRAVKSGEVIRPNKCSDCGKSCKPEGHHEDYDKPLEVVWLCGICHAKRSNYGQ